MLGQTPQHPIKQNWKANKCVALTTSTWLDQRDDGWYWSLLSMSESWYDAEQLTSVHWLYKYANWNANNNLSFKRVRKNTYLGSAQLMITWLNNKQ